MPLHRRPSLHPAPTRLAQHLLCRAGALGLISGALLVPLGHSPIWAVEDPAPTSSAPTTPTTPRLPGQKGPADAPAAMPAPGPQPEATGAGTGSPPAPAPISREIVLELGRRQISLKENGKVVRSWPVAIGDPSTPTPIGRFQVQNKVINPRYQSTRSGKVNSTIGPQGPLGDRWIGFKQSGANQYGIHGTPTDWAWTVTSRAAVSNGCVRMLTPHVRELFDRVEVGTPVIVQR